MVYVPLIKSARFDAIANRYGGTSHVVGYDSESGVKALLVVTTHSTTVCVLAAELKKTITFTKMTSQDSTHGILG